MLIRYELYIGDEYQGVGICQGISELGFEKEVEDYLLEPFNQKLPIPAIGRGIQRCSFFTETGDRRFKQDINRLIELYREYGLFDVKTVILTSNTISKEDILYKDPYQVIVREGSFKRNQTKGDQKMKDCKGQELKVGDYVAFVYGASRDPLMRTGHITKISPSGRECSVDGKPHVYSRRVLKLEDGIQEIKHKKEDEA